MIEGYGDCIFFLGEERNEVNRVFLAVIIFDWQCEIGKGVYVLLMGSPVMTLSINYSRYTQFPDNKCRERHSRSTGGSVLHSTRL